MLHFILGRAGTGKSFRIIEKIKSSVSNGKKCILIVPEQFSFETEKLILKYIPKRDYLKVFVLSFTRLSDFIFTKYGGIAGDYITAEEKVLLNSKAALSVYDSLKIYTDKLTNKSFIQNIMSIIDEMKNNAISIEEIEKMSKNKDLNEITRNKLSDIALIYSAFLINLEDTYKDSHDSSSNLERAIEIIKLRENKSFFNDYDLFIDGFLSFSQLQLEMIKEGIENCDNIYATFCCDGLNDNQNGFGVFSSNLKTAKKLKKIAMQNNVKIATPEVLTENKRYKSQELECINKYFLNESAILNEEIGRIEFNQNDKNIMIFSAENVYEQVDFICSEIWRLIREKQYRFNDIGIITQNFENSNDIFENAFSKYKIPIFFDKTEGVTTKGLFIFIQSVFDIINYGFRTEDVLKLLKTQAISINKKQENEPDKSSKIDEKSIGLIENYCYRWQIKSSMWKMPFLSNPEGLIGQANEEDTKESEEKLAEINEIRAAIIEPISKFHENSKDKTCEEISENLFKLIVETEIYNNLKDEEEKYISGFSLKNEDNIFNFDKIYSSFVSLLDKLVKIFGNEKMSIKRYSELFSLGAMYISLGDIPNTIDKVVISRADRIGSGASGGFGGKKVCFVCDFCEGYFPKTEKKYNVLTKKERVNLKQAGFNIEYSDIEEYSQQSFYAYLALTFSSEKLIITYPKFDRDYNMLYPSRYIGNIKELFLNPDKLDIIKKDEFPLSFFAVNEKTTLDAFVKSIKNKDNIENSIEVKNALKKFFLNYSDDLKSAKNKIEKIENATTLNSFKIEDNYIATQLFGKNLRLSASKIETFNNCPFSYFIQYAIKAKKIKKAEITPLESGGLIHDVLYNFVQNNDIKELNKKPDKEIKKEISILVKNFISEKLGGVDKLSCNQIKLVLNIERALFKIIIRISEEFNQSEFMPVDFELNISAESDIKPIILETTQGRKISVEGIVDRVDICEKKGNKYIRIIDYKSGNKSFNLSEVYYGLNMQMLIYLFSICKNGKERYLKNDDKNTEILPAGVLYFPAKATLVSAKKEDEKEKIKKEENKQFKMNGLLLDDIDIIKAQEKDVSGLFIPVSTKKDGTLKTEDSLATEEQLGKLRVYIEKQIIKIAESLHSGDIDAIPTIVTDGENDKKICDFCDYYSICLNENCEKNKQMNILSKDDFYNLINIENVVKTDDKNGEE